MAITNALIGVVLLIVSGVLGYWVQDREPPIHSYVAEVVPPSPRPGETLRIMHQLIRERRCHLRLQQIVFDQNKLRYTAPVQEYILAPGDVGPDRFMTSMVLPPEMAKGPAEYRAIRAYYCNPLHWLWDWPILLVAPDVRFTIGD